MDLLHHYHILTLTHRETKLTQLGKFVLEGVSSEENLSVRLAEIREHFGWDELLYLATCNRVMFFFSTKQSFEKEQIQEVFQFVRPERSEAELNFAAEHTRLYKGKEAIGHLFEVASSIDSLVVGEREILRQLREAYDACVNAGSTGDNIRLAMRFAVEAAKEVYTNTGIGEKPVSVVSLAMQRLRAMQHGPETRVLIVGAGQTNLLVSKFLPQAGFSRFAVFNRSIEGAQNLAKNLHGKAFRLDELPHYTEGFDVMIVCTAATEPIITPELYQTLLCGESDRKTVIDLSVPNNVSSQVVAEFPMEYIEVEDLRLLAKENLGFRRQEVTRAKQLLGQNLETFGEHFRTRQIELAMRGVPDQIRAVREHAINKVFRREVEALDVDARDLVERMMAYMEKNCIGIPMKAAKSIL